MRKVAKEKNNENFDSMGQSKEDPLREELCVCVCKFVPVL